MLKKGLWRACIVVSSTLAQNNQIDSHKYYLDTQHKVRISCSARAWRCFDYARLIVARVLHVQRQKDA